jgi:hypothetical protein
MGGPSAPDDDLRLGHLTQERLATSDDPEARSSGYWFHQRLQAPHPAVRDRHFQDKLLTALARVTGVPLT